MSNRIGTYVISIFCDSYNGKVKKDLILGYPNSENNPVFFQNKFLEGKQIKIPQEVIDSFANIYRIAKENKLDFLEVCKYTMENDFNEKLDNNSEDLNNTDENDDLNNK